MTDPGPWKAAPPPPAPKRPWALVMLAVAIAALIAALVRLFPERLRGAEDWMNVAYLAGFLLLMSAGVSRLNRSNFRQYIGHAAIWIGAVAALALGFAFQDELKGVGRRLALAFGGGTPVATGEREMSLTANGAGHFEVVGRVNGQRVVFMVDTGATETVLDPADAERAGIDLSTLAFDSPASTANGVGYSARQTADLEVGAIRLDGFEVHVNQAAMGGSLLGMSFLRRLKSYEVRGRTLVLRW